MKHGADTVMDDYEKNVFSPDERMAFRDKMVKYHGEIERLVYAAEILCPENNIQCSPIAHPSCPFALRSLGRGWVCSIYRIRGYIGDHIEQHDCMVPPCQCAGDCEEP